MRVNLGLQLDEKHLRLVVAEGERTVRVTRLVSLPRDESLGERLKAELAAYPKARVHLVLPPACQDHLTCLLPPLPASEAKAVIEREVRRQVSEDPLFAFEAGRRIEEQGGVKTEYQVAVAPRVQVEEHLRLLEAANAEAGRFLTVPLALAQVLSLHHEQPPEGQVWAVVQVAKAASNVVLVSEGLPLLSRRLACGCPGTIELPEVCPLEGSEEPPEEAAERLATEINRTGLYFKQRFRGRDIDRVLLCGEGDPASLAAQLTQQLNLTASAFEPGPNLLLPEEAAAEGLSGFALALGAVAPTSSRLNLLPPEYLERRRLRLKKAVVYGLAAMLALCAGLGWLGLRAAVYSYERLLTQQAPALAKAEAFLAEKEATDRERAACQWRRSCLERHRLEPEPWLALLARLSEATPPGARLAVLKVSRSGEAPGLVLSGEVAAGDAHEANRRYSRLHEALTGSALLAGLRETSEIGSEPVLDAKGHEVDRVSRLKFNLTGSFPP